MLSLANLKLVSVEGDGNCGFYSFLPTKDKLEHSKQSFIGRPLPAVDYAAQQALRVKCVHWLQNEGSGVAAYQFGIDASTATSSWSPVEIERLRLGKNSPRDRMGVYANEAALRAMAAVAWQNLVVINSRMGSNIEHPHLRNQPSDKVAVYLPGHKQEPSTTG